MKLLKITIITFALMFQSNISSAQDLDRAIAAAEAGDYVTARRTFRSLAEKGNLFAQVNLGLFYHRGQGVLQDYAEAMKWFRLAARQGDAFAQNSIALMYDLGEGVGEDDAEAMRWYRLAAKQGFITAQFNLGLMNEFARNLRRDNVKAHMWYNIAASNGHDKASQHRDMVAGKMTSAEISNAQVFARKCMNSGYNTCNW